MIAVVPSPTKLSAARRAVTKLNPYFHEDQLGSNRAETSVSKGKVDTQFSSGYLPYGQSYGATGLEAFQYTDRMVDSSTGLYYFNARFYDPAIMRFTSKDPVNPDSPNPYEYANSNPLGNTDPTGTFCIICGIGPIPNPSGSNSVLASGVYGATSALWNWSVQANNYFSKSPHQPLTLWQYCALSRICRNSPPIGHLAMLGLLVSTSIINPEGWGFAGTTDLGDVGEVELQQILRRANINTERGFYMNSATGELARLSKTTPGWVQLDLFDAAHNWAFESKMGYRGFSDVLDAEARFQAALVEKGYLNGVTWVSLPNAVGAVGFSKGLLMDTLFPLGIKSGYWTRGFGMTWYDWPWGRLSD